MSQSVIDLDVVDVFRVLALDDEEHVLNAIEEQLDPMGIDVIRARTAAEAIEILEARYIDAAFVDLSLEEVKSGREVLRAMRHHAPHAATVIATNYTDDLGEFIGLKAPRFEKILAKKSTISGDWAEKAIRRAFAEFKSGAVRIENIQLAIDLLEGRRKRLPRLRSGTELACEIDRLCRRLFGAATDPTIRSSPLTVSLRPIRSEGLSPAVTVEANVSFDRDLAKRPVVGAPVVLKIAGRRSTATEVDRYHRFVKYGVPLTHRVELLGHAEDRDLGAVCYSFAGNTQRSRLESLDEQLSVPERAPLVREVIESLFGVSAKSWYAVTAESIAARPYFSEGPRDGLAEAHEELERSARSVAKRAGSEVEFTAPSDRDDGEFRAGRERLCIPRRTVLGDGVFLGKLRSCLVHGDMHGGNVMIELDDDDERLKRICLIDYANAGPGPRLIDFVALEASIRLRQAQALLGEFGVTHERELSSADYTAAVMRITGQVVDERRLLASMWEKGQPPGPEWTRQALELSLLAHTNFDDLDENEYIAVAIPSALRHFGFHIGNLAKLRLAAWISAVYERHKALNTRVH